VKFSLHGATINFHRNLLLMYWQVPPTELASEVAGGNAGVASGRTVMTFDITMHQGDPASLGVTVHVSISLLSCDCFVRIHQVCSNAHEHF